MAQTDLSVSAFAGEKSQVKLFHQTEQGRIYQGDALALFREVIAPQSVDLIVTSPPYGLLRKKDYGNVESENYLAWFRPFASAFYAALKPSGSLVLNIGGSWLKGCPARSLYHYELLITLCREFGFHLAQEFFWWNPARLPTPAEWVTIRRIRVKDAVDCVWWLSPTPWPKASNRRVLQPYSESMRSLLRAGYRPKSRPSGHEISEWFKNDNGAAIPPNLIALAHTESNSAYLRHCRARGIKPHPARFPVGLPEFFIQMLTDVGDLVVDPFCGSCATGEAAERNGRSWVGCDLVAEYLAGALGRFQARTKAVGISESEKSGFYRIFKPAAGGQAAADSALPADGGRGYRRRKGGQTN